MRILSHQTKALQTTVEGLATKRLAAFVNRHFPHLAKLHAPDELRKLIATTGAHSKRRGLTTERDVATFTSLAFHLGSSFETDPQLQWAGRTLSLPSLDASQKLALTYKRAISHLRAVHGAEDAHWLAGLQRFQRSLSSTRLSRRCGALRPSEVATWLRNLYPQKSQALGEDGLKELIAVTTRAATRFDLNLPGATVLLAALTMFFGHGFHSDPQFPWASAALAEPADSAAIRLDRLQLASVRAIELQVKARKSVSSRTVPTANISDSKVPPLIPLAQPTYQAVRQ